jgi:hypothetical protein
MSDLDVFDDRVNLLLQEPLFVRLSDAVLERVFGLFQRIARTHERIRADVMEADVLPEETVDLHLRSEHGGSVAVVSSSDAKFVAHGFLGWRDSNGVPLSQMMSSSWGFRSG